MGIGVEQTLVVEHVDKAPAKNWGRPGGLPYSIFNNKSLASTCWPGVTRSCVTLPATGE